jgi:dihydroneopterin aldolase
MAIRSKLIEHAAGRILNSMREYMPNARAIKVLVTKFNPPVNGRIGKAVVEVGYSKN